MPVDDGAVGGIQIPVAAGVEGERWTDPAVDALLDFAAFYIKDAIDDKLARLTGTGHDAVPADNRFPFDPLTPRGHQIKLPRPALYVWWEGTSTVEQQTTIYDVRSRPIQFMYVYDELPHYDEMVRRAGMMSAIDAAMAQMSMRQVHADFGHSGDPSGTWINYTVADPNFMGWAWQGGFPGRFGIDEGPRAERRFAKKSGRDYPALKGSWLLQERVAAQTLVDPDDMTGDVEVNIWASDGESTDTMDFLDGVLQAPDGDK